MHTSKNKRHCWLIKKFIKNNVHFEVGIQIYVKMKRRNYNLSF